jgi:hypothetical protein
VGLGGWDELPAPGEEEPGAFQHPREGPDENGICASERAKSSGLRHGEAAVGDEGEGHRLSLDDEPLPQYQSGCGSEDGAAVDLFGPWMGRLSLERRLDPRQEHWAAVGSGVVCEEQLAGQPEPGRVGGRPGRNVSESRNDRGGGGAQAVLDLGVLRCKVGQIEEIGGRRACRGPQPEELVLGEVLQRQ